MMFEEDLKDYPAILSIKDIATILGISEPKAREIVYSKGFPILKRALTGKRILIPKQGFINWIQEQYQYDNKEA